MPGNVILNNVIPGSDPVLIQHLVIPGLTRNPIPPENTKHKPINNALHSRQSLEQKFRKLKAYIDEHHHLPDKKKVEHRGLLNWVKYNRKKIKAGTLAPEKERLFSDLLASRHAGPDPASQPAPAQPLLFSE